MANRDAPARRTISQLVSVLKGLLGVQLNDERFVNFKINILTSRNGNNFAFQSFTVHFQPLGAGTCGILFHNSLDLGALRR